MCVCVYVLPPIGEKFNEIFNLFMLFDQLLLFLVDDLHLFVLYDHLDILSPCL